MFLKESKLKKRLLLSLLFTHLACFLISFHVDSTNHQGSTLAGTNYWAWLSMWWCNWTAILSVFWAIYKLVSQRNNYWTSLFDLIVVISNIIMGIIFLPGLLIYYLSNGKAKWVARPKEAVKNFNFFGLWQWNLSVPNYWLFYTLIWHTVPLILTIYYFQKFTPKEMLRKKPAFTIISSLINPTLYFFYVIFRPMILNLNKLPYEYPFDYPFKFFYHCAGKQANRNDTNYPRSLTSRLLWIVGTFLVAYLIFSLLAYLFLQKSKTQHQHTNTHKAERERERESVMNTVKRL